MWSYIKFGAVEVALDVRRCLQIAEDLTLVFSCCLHHLQSIRYGQGRVAPSLNSAQRRSWSLGAWRHNSGYSYFGGDGDVWWNFTVQPLYLWEERTWYICDGKLSGLSCSERGDGEINARLCREWNRSDGISDLLRGRHTDRMYRPYAVLTLEVSFHKWKIWKK